ncbi:MAG: leucyl aminopeptidase family protein [Bacteroidota bacterium]
MNILLTDQLNTATTNRLVFAPAEGEQASGQEALLASLQFGALSSDNWTRLSQKEGFFVPNASGQLVAWLVVKSAPITTTINRIWKALVDQRTTLGDELVADLSLLDDATAEHVAFAIAHACVLAQYQIGLFKSKTKAVFELKQLQVKTTSASTGSIQTALEQGQIAGETRTRIMDLMNAPGNKLRPEDLANWALDSGKQFNYSVKVFEQEAIEAMGLGGLIAVNRGSEWPARFIIAEYKGAADAPPIGLVGKGVTFDTGGLSIKGHQNMHYMKSDMGGAAAVLGATEYIARLGLPVNLVTIVPTTDNCVDAKSVKPGDIITGYSGKTIEIIDTDAEGRLILSDALAYIIKHYAPETLIDAATLTGSAVRTLGYEAGALFTQNDELAEGLLAAGQQTGERLWRLPMYPAYLEDIRSDVADIKNLGPKPMAGASIAAKFLEFFTDEHPRWAHLDIAGVAFGNTPLTGQKSGTGYGILLLEAFIRGLIAS